MLCACSTIMFSGQEGYSFTFARFLFFSLFRKRLWVCVRACLWVRVLRVWCFVRRERLFSCSCSICLWILFIGLFPTGIQLKWRLLKAFAESIQNKFVFFFVQVPFCYVGCDRQYLMKILNPRVLKVWLLKIPCSSLVWFQRSAFQNCTLQLLLSEKWSKQNQQRFESSHFWRQATDKYCLMLVNFT